MTRKQMTGIKAAFFFLLLLGTTTSMPTRADMLKSLYLSAGTGWDYADNIRLDSNGAEMHFDQGVFQPSIAVGTRFLDDWRVELEHSEHENAPEILYSSSAGFESDSDEGDSVRASSLMLNVVRDFHVGLGFHPYIGAGIGQTKVSLRFSEPRIDEEPFNVPRRDIIHDDDSTLAWQFIAGFTVPISRRFDIGADYRFWQAPSVKLHEVSGASLDTSHSVQSVWAHVRFHAADAGVTASPVARAEAMSGLYVAGNIGGVFSEDAEITETGSVFDAFHVGPFTSVAVGYGWRERWRFELEGGYRYNRLDVYEESGAVGEDRADGGLSMATFMLNVIYEFAQGSSIRPYVGFGVGMARADYDVDTRTFCKRFVCGSVEERANIVDDHDTTFAGQAILGVDIALTSRLHVTADYRYVLTDEIDLQAPDDSALQVDTQRSNSISAGLRYDLGSPN